MRREDGADFVEFLDGEGVEGVMGHGGVVVARGVGWVLEEVGFQEAVLGGAPCGGAVE